MKKIALRILWSDNIQNFPHVIQHSFSFRYAIVFVVTAQPVLDLRESLLNGV
jgi:hypothetical protein